MLQVGECVGSSHGILLKKEWDSENIPVVEDCKLGWHYWSSKKDTWIEDRFIKHKGEAIFWFKYVEYLTT